MTASSEAPPEFYFSPEFNKNIKNAGKACVSKKHAEDFKAVIRAVIDEVIASPLAVTTSKGTGCIEWQGPEGSPGFLNTQAGSRFFKVYFKVPNTKGSAAQGRIMYMVQVSTLIVDFLMYYTHEEFEKRPPDKYLRSVFSEAGVPRDDS